MKNTLLYIYLLLYGKMNHIPIKMRPIRYFSKCRSFTQIQDIIFMHKGKVQEFNKVKSFFKRQKSIYAKSFVEGKIII